MTEKKNIPSGKLRARQKAETNKLILQSARFLFETQGFEKTTIRSIATHAEIGLGTIYKHFSHKTSIFANVFYEDINSIMEDAFKQLPTDVCLEEQMMNVASCLYHFYASQPKLAKTYLKKIAFIEGKDRSIVNKLDETFITNIVDLVEKAKIRGEVRDNVDSFILSSAYFSHYMTTLGFAFFVNEEFVPENVLILLRQFIDLMMNGVRPF